MRLTNQVALPAVLATALALAWACAPAATAPTPASKPTLVTADTKAALSPPTTPAASPAAKAAPSPTARDASAWLAVEEAARGEGRLVILGPPGVDAREALTQGFNSKYPEIAVDYTGAAGGAASVRVNNELAAGQHLTDVVGSGTTTIIQGLMPSNSVEDIHPYLVGPEVDPSKWQDGRFAFGDDAGKHALVYAVRVQVPFIINPNEASVQDFRSFRDLLDPKWKGRLAMGNPRVGGATQEVFSVWYTNLALGKEFIERFLAQEPTQFGDDQQHLDSLARGRYAIGVGANVGLAYEMTQRGLPVQLMAPERLAEGGWQTNSYATLSVVRQPPHPNAIKVFFNYLLSTEGQLAFSKASGLTSLRADVPRDHLPPEFVPKEGVRYRETYSEPGLKIRTEVVEFLQTLLRS